MLHFGCDSIEFPLLQAGLIVSAIEGHVQTVNLVPLGLGELLDKTFSMFRKHFWLFAGIMVLPQAMTVGIGILVQIYLSGIVMTQNPQTHQIGPESPAAAMRMVLIPVGSLIPHYIIYALALGATTFALSEVYLGRTTTIRESYRAVYRRVWRLLDVIFSVLVRSFGLFLLAIVLLTVMVGSVAAIFKIVPWIAIVVAIIAILGFIASGILLVMFLVRYCVAVPALVLENLKSRQALKRSVALTKGFLWRLLVVAVLMILITMTLVSIFQAPFGVAAFLIAAKGGKPGLWLTIPSLLLGGVAGIVTSPLLMISFAIAYYDLRVRKEGFDLQLMMSNLEASTTPGAAGQNQVREEELFEDTSVFGAVFLTFISGGIYLPIWFMTRRKAFNQLRSPEKLGIFLPLVPLAGFIANVCIPIVGSIRWGTLVEAENVLFPLHVFVWLVAVVIMVVQCFKARRMLLDHLAPRQEGMFSASIRFQYDDLFSRMATFFLGVFYLQHKINGLINRLTAIEGSQGEPVSSALMEPSLPTINS